jgi:hypothetical protein
MAESDSTRLQIARETNATRQNVQESKDDSRTLLGLKMALAGHGGLYEEEGEDALKIKTTKLKAIADYQAKGNSGSAAARARAIADLYKAVLQSPIQMAKLGGQADPRMLQSIANATGRAWGDSVPDGSAESTKAWQTFYGTANAVNGAALKATYDRIVEQYGPPEKAALGPDDALQRDREMIDRRIREQERTFDNADRELKKFTEDVDNGKVPTDPEIRRIQSLIPGGGDTAFIQKLQDDVQNEQYEPTEAQNKREKYLLDEIAKAEKGDKDASPGLPDDVLAKFVSTPKAAWWAEDKGFRMGRVIPLQNPDDPKEVATLQKQYPQAKVTKWGIYIPGPDDRKALEYAHRQMSRGPEATIPQALGLGRFKPAQIEFDVRGQPGAGRQASDGAWYFTTDADGKQVFLDEADVQKRKNALTVSRIAKMPDGKYLMQMSDGRYAYGEDGKMAFIPKLAGQNLEETIPEMHAASFRGGGIAVPDELKDALPAGVQRTTTPPKGAVTTIQGRVAERDPRDPKDSIAYFDDKGQRHVVKREDIVGDVTTLEGGNRPRTLGAVVTGAIEKGAEKREAKRVGEDQYVPEGEARKPTRAQAKAEVKRTSDLWRQSTKDEQDPDNPFRTRAKPEEGEPDMTEVNDFAPTPGEQDVADFKADVSRSVAVHNRQKQGRPNPYPSPKLNPTEPGLDPGQFDPKNLVGAGTPPLNVPPADYKPWSSEVPGGMETEQGDGKSAEQGPGDFPEDRRPVAANTTTSAPTATTQKGVLGMFRKKPTTGDTSYA